MKVITDISAFKTNRPAIATIGFFDGFHLGHAFLIEQLKAKAKKYDLSPIVLTFDQHPRVVLDPNYQPKMLSSLEERLSLLEQAGVEHCVVLSFTKELAKLSSYDFMQQVLLEKLGVKALTIGYDHRFGSDRENGFEQYVKNGQALGMKVYQEPPFIYDQQIISSSLIRKEIEQGTVSLANLYLDKPYSFQGKVIHGDKLGRDLGYPTANLQIEAQKLIPAIGIYAVLVKYQEKTYQAMLSIGKRPSVKTTDGSIRVEVHLFDFKGEIYGEDLKVYFIAWMREELKFKNLDLLVEQLDKDKIKAQKLLKNISI